MLAPGVQNYTVFDDEPQILRALRIVLRDGFSADMAEILLGHLERTVREPLEAAGARAAAARGGVSPLVDIVAGPRGHNRIRTTLRSVFERPPA